MPTISLTNEEFLHVLGLMYDTRHQFSTSFKLYDKLNIPKNFKK